MLEAHASPWFVYSNHFNRIRCPEPTWLLHLCYSGQTTPPNRFRRAGASMLVTTLRTLSVIGSTPPSSVKCACLPIADMDSSGWVPLPALVQHLRRPAATEAVIRQIVAADAKVPRPAAGLSWQGTL